MNVSRNAMNVFFGRRVLLASLIAGAALVVSYVAHVFPRAGDALFFIVCVGSLWLTMRRLTYGTWLLLGELALGSKGYLFSVAFGGVELSYRFALFAIVLTVWALRVLSPRRHVVLPSAAGVLPYLFLLLAVVWGTANGLLQGNGLSTIFVDANGFLYFALLPVFVATIRTRRDVVHALQICAGVVITASVWTLGMAYVFAHGFDDVTYGVYRWIRDAGIGEITRYTGAVYRFFLQSQLYVGFVLCLVYGLRRSTNQRVHVRLTALTALLVAIMLVSLSRSYWIGLAGAAVVLVAVSRTRSHDHPMLPWRSLIRWSVVVTFIASAILVAVIWFPIPRVDESISGSVLASRVTDVTNESAAASRWSLVPPLVTKIAASPVFGHGFGTTVTYRSSDPRIVAETGGEYTTYAFEWGYLDLWLKLGIIGVLCYGFLLWRIFAQGLRVIRIAPDVGGYSRGLALGLVAGMAFVAVTHAFSPYLNHPLGIGILLLADASLAALTAHE